MKLILWVGAGLLVLGAACWIVTANGMIDNPAYFPIIFLIFAIAPAGTLWMFYKVIRHEQHPLPFLLLACVPFVFGWYYFERLRTGVRPREL
jgi:hypothetical protein